MFAAAAMVAALLTGCSSSESNTLTFWNPLTGDDGAYMRQIVQDYNATKPQYPVTFQPMAEAGMYTKVYSVMNAKADIPDVMIMHAVLTAEKLQIHNTPEAPDAVAPRSHEQVAPIASGLRVHLPAHSFVTVEARLA
ncbi:hypothetical protein [Nonomuraea jabiensis]|uniref:hypothetical protein n=1 Tax=Nonomuraea jabiensis TaxID=882448 RepID=UPI0036B6CE21